MTWVQEPLLQSGRARSEAPIGGKIPPRKEESQPMPRALWNGKVIAESDVFETVEGNVYFPPGKVHLRPSRH
jgi:uncharacterized protein (DUF427 family)